MKKFFALLLALVMVLSLVACGNTTTDVQEPDVPDEDAWHTSNTEVPEGRVEVKYWCPHGSGTSA